MNHWSMEASSKLFDKIECRISWLAELSDRVTVTDI